MIRKLLLIVFALGAVVPLALPASPPLAAGPHKPSDLQMQLDEMAAHHRGKVALFARNLKTGETVEIDAARPVQTASTIKLPVLIEAFAQVQAGKRRLDDKIILRATDKVQGSGVLQFLHSGIELTLEDALWMMVIESDNTATNLVLDQVTIPAVNARITRMGLKDTYLYKKVYKPAEGPMPADQKKFGLGKTTAREMESVMESIETCALGDKKLCHKMIEILKNQQYHNMIPHYLLGLDPSESESPVADKVGALDASRSDVGICYGKNGPIVMSIYTYENKDHSWNPENEGEMLVARMAQAIAQAWSPPAKH